MCEGHRKSAVKKLAVWPRRCAFLILVIPTASAFPGPFDGKNFKGRIAWSCDGNYNDEDDWAASPAALALFAEFGVKDRLVHFDYNDILPATKPDWEREHQISIAGARQRYQFREDVFYDCRRNLDAAVASIARAINASSAENPLYWIVAGPMEVPYLGIQKSDLAKRRHVYCISHSRWNDGFARGYVFPYNKRPVIESGIHWIQIADQNRGLSTGPFGRPHTREEWAPWLWMQDSAVEPVRFLWERLRATKRADCSDAGMAYFLLTGDEQADIAKLRRVIEGRDPPAPSAVRPHVRLEAENFPALENHGLEDTDRSASHRLNVKLAAGASRGRIRGPFHEPYTPSRAHYNLEIRYDPAGGNCDYELHLNGVRQGDPWRGEPGEPWQSHRVEDVVVATGDTIAIASRCTDGAQARLDYVQLNSKQ